MLSKDNNQPIAENNVVTLDPTSNFIASLPDYLPESYQYDSRSKSYPPYKRFIFLSCLYGSELASGLGLM